MSVVGASWQRMSLMGRILAIAVPVLVAVAVLGLLGVVLAGPIVAGVPRRQRPARPVRRRGRRRSSS